MKTRGSSPSPFASTLLILAAAALALALRLPRLGDRPLHTDEAVQGVVFGDLLERGAYAYNPVEYHGPTLYYLTLPVAWARGEWRIADVPESTIRLIPVLFGAALILLLRPLRRELPPAELGAAALLTAVSPMFVYFSRYYIQEMLLVVFTFGLMVCLWRYHRTRRRLWMGWAGAFAGLMHATKETCVIALASLVVAWWLTRPRADWLRLPRIPLRHLLLGGGVAALVSALFYSSFFTHLRGPWDSVAALLPFSAKSSGTGHDKPWSYYLQILAWWHRGGLTWQELPILVPALAGFVAAWRPAAPGDPAARFRRVVAVYAPLCLLAYSLIPYKTPWLALGPLHGLVLLAGTGFAALWQAAARPLPRAVLLAAFAAAAFSAGRLAWRGATRFGADERNPCAYSHTARDCVRLVERVRGVAPLMPKEEPFVVKVASPEYWPLPWYFRALPHVGYWTEPPDDLAAPVVILGGDLMADAAKRLAGDYHWEPYGLRPGMVLFAGVRADLWEAYLATRAKPAAAGKSP